MQQKKKYPNIEKLVPQSCTAGQVILSSRLISQIYKKHFKQHGITLSQWSILSVLCDRNEIGQADLGRMLALERSTVSRDLKRLIEKGYVRKLGEVNNLVLRITEKGMDRIEVIIPDWEKAKKEAGDLLGEDGEQALLLLLNKLNNKK